MELAARIYSLPENFFKEFLIRTRRGTSFFVFATKLFNSK